MLLPNAEFAHIPLEKLRHYALDPSHPIGRHKAKVFAAVLGLTADDSENLRDIIQTAILKNKAAKTRLDEHGQRYEVKFELERNGRRAVILTAWIIEPDDFQPRLTSCYIQ